MFIIICIIYDVTGKCLIHLVVRKNVSRDNVTPVPKVQCINIVIFLLLGYLSYFILKSQHNLNKKLFTLYMNKYI